MPSSSCKQSKLAGCSSSVVPAEPPTSGGRGWRPLPPDALNYTAHFLSVFTAKSIYYLFRVADHVALMASRDD